jgi:O-antigen/teichoic acid export membrane protein
MAAVILIDLGFLWLFLVIALANFAQLVAATVILSWKFVHPVLTVERGMYRRFFKDSLVIGVGVFFYHNLFKINVLMLRWIGSIDDVAFFSVPHNLIMQLQIVPLSLSLAVFPVFSRLIATDRERLVAIYERIFRVMFVISAFAAVMLSLHAREVITLMFGSKFEQSVAAMAVVAWAMIPLTMDMLLNGLLIAMNKQRYSVIFAGVTIVLNIAASVLFIPRYGFMAAAWIAVASYTLLFVCSHYVVVRNGVAITTARTVASTVLAAGGGALAVALIRPDSLFASLLVGSLLFGLVVLATGAIRVRELMLLRESLRTERRASPA